MSLFRKQPPAPQQPLDPRVVRRFFVLHGRVQGVGLRYRVSTLAKRLGLTGWVKNEYDGSVSMELQGLPETIDQLFAELQRDSYVRIRDLEQEDRPIEPETRFRVQY